MPLNALNMSMLPRLNADISAGPTMTGTAGLAMRAAIENQQESTIRESTGFGIAERSAVTSNGSCSEIGRPSMQICIESGSAGTEQSGPLTRKSSPGPLEAHHDIRQLGDGEAAVLCVEHDEIGRIPNLDPV